MISFIVPAHNEEFWIGKCLGSIRTTMGKLNEPYEVIVVDDASTDSTHQIARRLGARIHRVEHRRISAVRNAGARAACGELFFFVDAFALRGPRYENKKVLDIIYGRRSQDSRRPVKPA